MQKTTTPFKNRPTTRGKPFGGRAEGRAASLGRDDAELRTIALDLLQLSFRLSGVKDPAPASRGKDLLLALARGRWYEALMSGATQFPYVADVAQSGQLRRAIRAVSRAIHLCQDSSELIELLIPGLQRLKNALDLLPNNASRQVDQMKELMRNFLLSRGAVKLKARVPDISRHFRFSQYAKLDREYHEASGWLGIPGKIKTHRRYAAQRKMAGGTGDDAGHLIGDRFGAPGGEENLGPQNWRSNRGGTYKEIEDHWDRRLQVGDAVFVRIIDVAKKGENRPFLRRVIWTEVAPSGKQQDMTIDFANTHTVESRAMRGLAPLVEPMQSDNVIFVDFLRRRRI